MAGSIHGGQMGSLGTLFGFFLGVLLGQTGKVKSVDFGFVGCLGLRPLLQAP